MLADSPIDARDDYDAPTLVYVDPDAVVINTAIETILDDELTSTRSSQRNGRASD